MLSRSATMSARTILVCPSFTACLFETWSKFTLSSTHMQHHRQHTSNYQLQQVDTLPTEGNESITPGPVWMDSFKLCYNVNHTSCSPSWMTCATRKSARVNSATMLSTVTQKGHEWVSVVQTIYNTSNIHRVITSHE